MRKLFEIYLDSFGYGVVIARDGEEALQLVVGRSDIRVMIMDVVMPGLSGQPLVEKVMMAIPGLRVLFCSGHPARVMSNYGIDLATGKFLQKPCRPADLKRSLEELLAPA